MPKSKKWLADAPKRAANLAAAAEVDDGNWHKPEVYFWWRMFGDVRVHFYPTTNRVTFKDELGFVHSIRERGIEFIKARFMP